MLRWRRWVCCIIDAGLRPGTEHKLCAMEGALLAPGGAVPSSSQAVPEMDGAALPSVSELANTGSVLGTFATLPQRRSAVLLWAEAAKRCMAVQPRLHHGVPVSFLLVKGGMYAVA